MKFSMIVTITSCAPNRALRYAGTAPTTPPAAPAAIMQRRTAKMSGVPDRERQTRQRRRESAGRELALGADVEQSGAEAERDGEPGEGERRRLVEHLAEAVRVPPRPFEQQPVHVAPATGRS